MIKDQFETTVKRVYSDNAKEFFNQILSSFNEQWIIHESSCVNTSEQNGGDKTKNWASHKFNSSLSSP